MSYSRHSRHFDLSKKWLLILGSVLIATFIGLFFHVKAQALEPKNNVNLYLFWGDGCPHCAHAKDVLEPYIKQQIIGSVVIIFSIIALFGTIFNLYHLPEF